MRSQWQLQFSAFSRKAGLTFSIVLACMLLTEARVAVAQISKEDAAEMRKIPKRLGITVAIQVTCKGSAQISACEPKFYGDAVYVAATAARRNR